MATITNEVKQLAINKAKKLGFIFNPTEIGQIQHDTILDYEHEQAFIFLCSEVPISPKKYKLITDVSVVKHSSNDQHISFDLPFGGYVEVQGEFNYNQKLKRYEHDTIDEDGSNYLVIWN